MKTKVIIIGGKGAAIVVAEQIYDAQIKGADVELLGFAFDDESLGKEINGFPILCKTYEAKDGYSRFSDIKFIYQLYRPDVMAGRIDLLNSYRIPADKFYTFIHPSSFVARSASIGFGCSILANAVINPNVKIGNHCSIHSNSLIGHDTKMGDYNFIAAHSAIGSNNEFGNANFVGLNSTFNNYITVGNHCFIGMASNVVKSINDGEKVYGNPAKEFNKQIKPL
ncbi:sialic acid O-acetyltransferase [Pontibacter sp. FD36]|uniref:sialic acid O-acetyltransferase n=1 Tax=Pontibacter sp. FD36 TaxID=2789860 RepID=UPI0018AA55F4|nr:sialic acid O-acetyltransferase [Pontibacter sp. FD36]MBF8964219.1 sialic acid O-acetyltransferase [Pontibacter sp. FD36]